MRLFAGLLPFLLFAFSAAHAQQYGPDKPLGSAAQQPPAYLAHAGIEQRLGQPLPMDSVFTDETGRTAPLHAWFDGRPLVMAEVYYRCSMLCPQVLHGLAVSLSQATLTPGKDYDVLVFSIDPMDKPSDAANEKRDFLHQAGAPFASPSAASAVHFLTGTQASIDAVSGATGFHFVRVPGPDGKLDQFAHSSVILFATPDGRMSKYLAGVSYEPRDVRLALLEASHRHISNPVDLLILYCCNYSPQSGRYTVSVLRVLGIAGMGSLAAMIGVLFLMTRKPRTAGA